MKQLVKDKVTPRLSKLVRSPKGHSSPEQAGQIAQQAGVRKLYLIHYPVDAEVNDLVNRAKTCFSGGVVAARDLMTIEFS